MEFKVLSLMLMAGLLSVQLVGCKSTEEIRREQMMDEISNKVGRSEEQLKVVASNTNKLVELDSRINKMSGELEEIRYQQTQTQEKVNQQISEFDKRLAEFNAMIDDQKKTLTEMQNQFNEQKSYIEQVIKSLSRIQENLTGEKPKIIKKRAKSGNKKVEPPKKVETKNKEE